MSLEQIARDMRDGTFPAKSQATLREEAVSKIAMSSLDVGAPGMPPVMRRAIARSFAMKVVAKLDEIIAVQNSPQENASD